MKNIPNTIYLNIGENVSNIKDFKDLEEVTWSENKATGDDIPYILKSEWHDIRKHPKDIPENPNAQYVAVYYDGDYALFNYEGINEVIDCPLIRPLYWMELPLIKL